MILTQSPLRWNQSERKDMENAMYSDAPDLDRPRPDPALTGALFVPGAIALYAGKVPPTDWAICDGADLPRARYARLFEIIGTSFGAGDGETTFNLPNIPPPVEGVYYVIRLGADLPPLRRLAN